MLILTQSGAGVFSASGNFDIGFASATGGALGSGSYTLFTFASQTSTSKVPSLSNYHAVTTGNLSSLNAPANAFNYIVDGNGQETLVVERGDAGTAESCAGATGSISRRNHRNAWL